MPRVRITKDRETRRKELLDAAESLFAELGYDSTAVSQIVEKVGVRQGTFYHYFQSKEEMVEALLTRSIETVAERIIVLLERGDTTLQERILAALEETFTSPAASQLIFEHMDKARNGFLSVRLHLIMSERLAPLMIGLLEEGNAAGVFSVAFPGETADFIIGGISFLMEKEMSATSQVSWDAMRPSVASLVEHLLGAPVGWLSQG